MVEAHLRADFLDEHEAALDFTHHWLSLGTQTTPITIGDLRQQATFQVFTVAIGADMDTLGRLVVTASSHLDGACIDPSYLVEPQWYT